MIPSLDRLLERIAEERLQTPDGPGLISALLQQKPVNRLPLVFWRPQNTAVPGSSFAMDEQFFCKEKMLAAHLEDMAACAAGTYDAVLCIRPNFGTVFVPAMLGLDFTVPPNAYPWLTSHFTKKQILAVDPNMVSSSAMMERCREYIAYFRQILPEWIHVYMPDTQGPFDLAHLLLGDQLFLELYDDPAFVHHVLEIVTQAYIAVTKEIKQALNEPLHQCFHGHALARGIVMENGGARISEDSATLLKPEHIDEFVLPYDKAALEEFGGGFVHYCGKNEHLMDAYLQMDCVRAVNLGNPEMHDFSKTMHQVVQQQKCYFGLWPALEGETCREYVQRMRQASNQGRQGLILHWDESLFPQYTCGEIHALWTEAMTQVTKPDQR